GDGSGTIVGSSSGSSVRSAGDRGDMRALTGSSLGLSAASGCVCVSVAQPPSVAAKDAAVMSALTPGARLACGWVWRGLVMVRSLRNIQRMSLVSCDGHDLIVAAAALVLSVLVVLAPACGRRGNSRSVIEDLAAVRVHIYS